MGTAQSTHTTSEINPSFPKEGPSSVSGRKIKEDDIVLVEPPTPMISIDSDDDDDDDDDSSVVSSDADYVEESDDEADSNEEDGRWLLSNGWLYLSKDRQHHSPSLLFPSIPRRKCQDEEENERFRILEDAQQLKKLAGFFLQPENPVAADATACARCFYSRYSAPEQTPADDEEEAALALADAKQLKQLAVDYLHPELSVKVDPASMGRNYFDRPSAEPQEDLDAANERAQILQDAKQLKQLAVDYLHPEKPVVASDPCATGRNFFTRPSAGEYEDDAEERNQILHDMKQLKKLAVDYLHPEKPVESSDPCATGRNYFTRASAPEYEGEDEMDERDEIMEEMKQLKQLAQDYLEPERAVEVDPLASFRNYFERASAPEQDSWEEAEERARILADAQQLKKLAVDYLHPEKPVVTTDPCAFGRNYFTRPSAPEFEDESERAQILEEMKQLKKLAVDYLHPEKPVLTSDPCAFGRNFFSRPSAEEYEDEDEMDERDEILEKMKQLKQLAQDYLQPERPVEVDPLASCRNYFTRPSAEEYEDDAEERNRVLEDMKQLKKLAVDYLHPEKPVESSDPCATGRNYFTRASAPEYEGEDEMDERDEIMEEMKQLKQLAQDYLQPERPVEVDPLASCRNYFTRPSAESQEDAKEAEERVRILADAKQFKKLAVDFLHPEKPLVTSDPCAFGRNYFSRPSAPEFEDEFERAQIFEEMKQLKKLAIDYLHPEKPVLTSDPCALGRNYFDRPSAPDHADHIHTQGHLVEHYTESHAEDHEYYHYHDYHHGHDGDSHSHVSDHFEMDEDMFHEFRESLQATEPFKGEPIKEAAEGEDEGKLSRSPSSVMLFEEPV